MSKLMNLNIMTISGDTISVNITKIISKSTDGQFEVCYNHMPIIINTIPAETVVYDKDNNKRSIFTSQGILYVNKNELEFCCNSAEWPENIDYNRAEKALERAEKRIKENHPDINIERAKRAMARALARLEIRNDE